MWHDALVDPDESIRRVLQVIEKGAIRVAFVIDKKQQFLGIVTDSDVRRGLLRQVSLDDTVSLIMNRSPLVSHEHGFLSTTDRQRVLSHQIDWIPVLHEGRLVDVMSAQQALAKLRQDNPVFIMAGGFGTRLRPLTDHCPKPMLKVHGVPLLERIINNFKELGFHRFYISTHYLPEMITDYFGDGTHKGVSIQYVYEKEPLGTGGALSLLPDDIGDLPIVMMNGDVLTSLNFIELLAHHQNTQSVATMCVREYEVQIPYGVISTDDDGFVQGMVEKPIERYYVNAGIYVLEPRLMRAPELKARIDMPTLLEMQMAKKDRVSTYAIYEYWLDIGRLSDFEKAQLDVVHGLV